MPRLRVQHRFQGTLEEKHCLGCDEWKVLKEFSKHKKKWDGLQGHCKGCKSIAKEKRRRKLGMKPRPLAEHRFQGALEEKHCLGCDEWKLLKEFGKHKGKSDGLTSQCKVCANIAHKKRVSTELGRRQWRKKSNAYKRRRYREDPAYAILCRLRRRVRGALKAQGAKKSIGTITLLGCTSAFFRSYIEKQFVDGMTWENRDKWHIDHRVPCSAFNMLDPLEQRCCFWYKNQQPMWANDNLCKNAKYKQEDKERLIKEYLKNTLK